jgi:hypothetical protein
MTLYDDMATLQAEVRQLRKQMVSEPVRHEKPLGGGGSWNYVVARRYHTDDPTGVGDKLMCSPLSWNGTAWAVSSSEEVALFVEPGLVANNYDPFLWPGTGAESYPLLLSAIGNKSLPTVMAGPRRTVLHFSRVFFGEEIVGGMPVTEGYIENAQGEVDFAN